MRKIKLIFLSAFLLFFTVFSTINSFAYIPAEITSDTSKVIFSERGGFYDKPFNLTLTVPNNRYEITYTIDGSNPQTSTTAIKVSRSKTIIIDPKSSSGRAKTPGYIVRASLIDKGNEILLPLSQTYIFLNEVVNQDKPGGKWPSKNINGQIIDLAMDKNVTQNRFYKDQMILSLQDIPSISVVTDLEALFSPDSGIYVNAWAHGPEWERFCSVELLDDKTHKHFNINAGLRIRGGWSRHNDFPKHAFRLFFREEYGNAKLNFPLFEEEGVEEFDKIDLRCAQNYAWSNGQSRNTMVREVFSRDSQRDMGQPYTRSRYYHLYLNGMYWGLFQTQERSEARFGKSYFGGSTEDFDVVKVNTDYYQYEIEATDGNLDTWELLWKKCQTGFKNKRDYFILEGKDENGIPIKGKEKLLDIDNLIDYMISIFYTGNFDAPTSSFRGNREPNNFYALFRRDDKTQGFIFFNHDAEHSMMYEAVDPGKGIEENRVQLQGMHVDDFKKFNPQWLHHKLSENAEYRQRFADRAYRHFFNDGVFTPHKAEERFMKRAKEIELAVIAESARWGDSKRGNNPYTKDNDWLPEIANIQSYFFPFRTDIVVDQLIDANLYSNSTPPSIVYNEKTITSDHCYFYTSAEIKISKPNSGGVAYYTTDGSDPRAIGGSVTQSAQMAENENSLSINGTTVITSRTKNGSQWSALKQVRFIKDYEDYNNLRITEFYYWPPDSIIGSDTISGKKFEFVEFKNIGGHASDLSRLKFHTGINFQFANKAILQPGEFYVIAANSKWFFERYGKAPSDIFKKSLSNEGEMLAVIADDGRVISDFFYSEQSSWYNETANTGYSVAASKIYPIGDSKDDGYWQVSSYLHGSPFADDTGFPLENIEYSADNNPVQIYPNPTNGVLTVNVFDEGSSFCEIYNSTGQLIDRSHFEQQLFIDLANYNIQAGMVILKITSKGKPVFRKIIYQP